MSDQDCYDYPCYNCGGDKWGSNGCCYACWSHVVPRLLERIKVAEKDLAICEEELYE